MKLSTTKKKIITENVFKTILNYISIISIVSVGIATFFFILSAFNIIETGNFISYSFKPVHVKVYRDKINKECYTMPDTIELYPKIKYEHTDKSLQNLELEKMSKLKDSISSFASIITILVGLLGLLSVQIIGNQIKLFEERIKNIFGNMKELEENVSTLKNSYSELNKNYENRMMIILRKQVQDYIFTSRKIDEDKLKKSFLLNAIPLANSLLSLNKLEGHLRLGEIYSEIGDSDSAIYHFNEIIMSSKDENYYSVLAQEKLREIKKK